MEPERRKGHTMSNERLGKLEVEVQHTQKDVHEIKADIREIKNSSKNVEMAVIELAEIAKTNQRLFPRIETLESKVAANHTRLTYLAGAGASLLFVLTFFGKAIRAALGF